MADALKSGIRASRLSSGTGPPPVWAIAIFAHNEAARLQAALDSLPAAASGHDLDVFVLANGCTDRTADIVRRSANRIPHLSLVEIDLGDKANAWNTFVHDILTPARAAEISLFFFMDGDVTAGPNALPLLAAALEEIPSAKAAGAMPATGRDREAWRERMVENATLAGCLYALRGSFVARIRAERIRMPIGLIGEDHFVSWLVASELSRRQPLEDSPQCVFHVAAEFSFRSLSLARPGDYRLYLRRKWRYTCRALQHQMLTTLLRDRGLVAMPRDVDELYRVAPLPSRLVWIGWETPLRLWAVLFIRGRRPPV
jgi:glycosyltransferase involved in cell wall biosynthesis